MADTKPVANDNVPTFAGVMMLVLGFFNLIDGFALLHRGNMFEANYLVGNNADTWGWIMIVFAALQLIAGIKLMSSGTGKWLAISLSSLSMMLWFGLIFVSPFASLIGVGINFAIIMSVLSTEPLDA